MATKIRIIFIKRFYFYSALLTEFFMTFNLGKINRQILSSEIIEGVGGSPPLLVTGGNKKAGLNKFLKNVIG